MHAQVYMHSFRHRGECLGGSLLDWLPSADLTCFHVQPSALQVTMTRVSAT